MRRLTFVCFPHPSGGPSYLDFVVDKHFSIVLVPGLMPNSAIFLFFRCRALPVARLSARFSASLFFSLWWSSNQNNEQGPRGRVRGPGVPQDCSGRGRHRCRSPRQTRLPLLLLRVPLPAPAPPTTTAAAVQNDHPSW